MEKQRLKIAVYGKGGIGKSTICSALSLALSRRGLTVMQLNTSQEIEEMIEKYYEEYDEENKPKAPPLMENNLWKT